MALLLGLLGLREKEIVPPSAKLQIIGAGLPKTGTKSLQTALEMLGYVPLPV